MRSRTQLRRAESSTGRWLCGAQEIPPSVHLSSAGIRVGERGRTPSMHARALLSALVVPIGEVYLRRPVVAKGSRFVTCQLFDSSKRCVKLAGALVFSPLQRLCLWVLICCATDGQAAEADTWCSASLRTGRSWQTFV